MPEGAITGADARARVDDAARQLFEAQRSAQPLAPLSTAWSDMRERDGYAVQDRLVALQCAAEQTGAAALKLGLTSRAKQQTMGVHEPIYGVLLASRRVAAGGSLPLSGLIHPRIEPEIAVRLERGIAGSDTTERDVAAALGTCYLAMEIIDSRFAQFRFTLPDVVADNTSAARYAVAADGRTIAAERLRALTLTFERNGETLGTADGSAILGDPLTALAWLARKRAERGLDVPAGTLVLCGAVMDAAPMSPGDTYRLRCPELGELAVSATA